MGMCFKYLPVWHLKTRIKSTYIKDNSGNGFKLENIMGNKI